MNFNNAKFLASYGLLKQIPPSTTLEIAFSGRSNVGKSSLINKIFNRKSLARVSSVPGKTVTINFYDLPPLNIVDLPGYGFAKVAKSEKIRWSELIEGYFNDDRQLALVVQLIDMRHPPTALDLQMINYLIDLEIPFIIALTKCDKLSKKQQEERLKALPNELPDVQNITIVPFSAVNGTGVEEIRKIIENIAKECNENE